MAKVANKVLDTDEAERFSLSAERKILGLDLEAAEGSFKIDSYVTKLAARLQRRMDVVALRRAIAAAAINAAHYDVRAREALPLWIASAGQFLAKLEEVRAGIRELVEFDPEQLSEVLVPVGPSIGDDQFESVRQSTEILLRALTRSNIAIEDYLGPISLPKYRRPSNRADCFILEFTKQSAAVWRRHFDMPLETSHRKDFAGLIGAALEDFGYPRSEEQLSSDDWIYERIGKYDIWK